ncbi:MAG: hypothetical protein FWH11_01435 [Micrococcales bacterium]|nr:hypothetical protein [Micrococcales bacterium]
MRTQSETTDYGRGVVGVALSGHRPDPWGASRKTRCSCGQFLDDTFETWWRHAAQAVVDALGAYELRLTDACDTMAEVADEVSAMSDHHGPPDGLPVGGQPLHQVAALSDTPGPRAALTTTPRPSAARRVRVPLDAETLARFAARSVAHEAALAEAGVGDGPSLHDLLLADVTAAFAAADDPEAWRRAMVRVAATAVWCASRGDRS